MIRVAVEVCDGVTSLRKMVSADSVRQAVSATKERYPERDVRVVFPISPEDFFLEDRNRTGPRPDDGQQDKPSRPRSIDRGTL